MDATCAGCGRPLPNFARVCEHCGHQAVDQLQLPSFAPPLKPEESAPPPDNFDFAPDHPAGVPPSVDYKLEPFQAAGEPDAFADDVRTEVAQTASPPANGSQESADASGGAYTTRFGSSSDPMTQTPAAAPVKSKRREIMLVTVAATMSGILTLGLLLTRTTPGTEVAAASTSASAATVERAAPVSSAPVTHWTAANSEIWAGPQKSNIAFEVEAENNVSVWMRTVRPAFVVRCTAGTVEAFVFTASAAQIEPQTDDHTVQFGFDAADEVKERWKDSEEHDALFAPDGAAFIRRLLAARVMRFGFTPHNAAPVTARFNVGGLAEMMGAARRQCGKF